ncbi:MAG: 4Fe-4S binding protein [Thiovulaceae bacterium]|nr:4Fe-4S binding protein [Sulfurimonadaceae bacterium]
MALEFLQKSNLLSYKGDKCLRNDYARNACTICLDICPADALIIDRLKFVIDGDKCVACAGCLGGCPTESLTLENFDPNTFVLSFASLEKPELSCKQNTSCLAGFDAQHLVTMSLKSDNEPVCDLSHCATCDLNSESLLSDTIRQRIDQANIFMKELGLEKTVTTLEVKEDAPKQRFGVFKKMYKSVDTVSQDQATAIYSGDLTNHVPLKTVLLKNALREHMRDIKNTTLTSESHIFTRKEIDFDKCTNCHECVLFCPTKALISTDDKQGILFNGGDCIGCGICEDACKDDAIKSSSSFDLVNLVYDRVEELVHYEMAKCHECKCAYPYKGGEQICDRCKGFTEEHEGLFTLARDL